MRIRSSGCAGVLGRLRAWVALTLLWVASAAHATTLEVFACEPEWAEAVRILAPDARITIATHARQDPHHIEARPALIGALRRANLAVCTGASLEAGWLPALQQRAANRAVVSGAPGLFFSADAVTLIDTHTHVDRSMGDVHAEGNPHLHLDPERFEAVVARLAERLATLDPTRAAAYAERLARWRGQWQARIDAWRSKAEPLDGLTVVAQHSGFKYLFEWLGIDQIADLEPKPGLPPTVSHLQRVLRQVAEEPPVAVVQSLYQDPQAGRWLVERIKAPLLVLPSTTTADGPAASIGGLFDTLIDALLAARAEALAREPVRR